LLIADMDISWHNCQESKTLQQKAVTFRFIWSRTGYCDWRNWFFCKHL